MYAVLSPAKKLDFDPPEADLPATEPELLADAEALVGRCRRLTHADLKRLMKLSDALAELNVQRFRAFETPFDPANAKQAALTFAGDTYVGLKADTFTPKDWEYAQGHLGILSGLFGLLRPLDLIQPYRLEMGTRLDTERGRDLYAFWGDRIGRLVGERARVDKDPTVINLASKEYFKAVDADALPGEVITPVFKELRGGQAKVIGLMAKRARGAMARYMVKKKLKKPDALKKFDEDGYAFAPKLSSDTEWVFLRES